MSKETAESHSTVDPYKHLGIVANADGTITRYANFPSRAAQPEPVDDLAVLSKDVPINQTNNTGARIFLPRRALDSPSSPKLPLILHFHGGGFIFCSPATEFAHDFCFNVALECPAVVVSVDYRLAPEHRLPAAYDDAMEALYWIKTTHEEWLRKYADLSRTYLIGESAGGNIAYHTGLIACAQVDNLLPLKIMGVILTAPFFGGVKRTESELRLINDSVLPAFASDLLWELALPIGADRDHDYCNPAVGGGPQLLDQIRLQGWKMMVSGSDGDPLIDRQMELAKIMENKGLQLVTHFTGGGYHGAEVMDPTKRDVFIHHIKNFFFAE